MQRRDIDLKLYAKCVSSDQTLHLNSLTRGCAFYTDILIYDCHAQGMPSHLGMLSLHKGLTGFLMAWCTCFVFTADLLITRFTVGVCYKRLFYVYRQSVGKR